MAVLSYMQRRKSGIYEFRRRLPQQLAGRSAPQFMRTAFPDLINPKTGCFKRELVKSLGTSDVTSAKRKDFAEGAYAHDLFQAALAALSGADSDLSDADIEDIVGEVQADLLRSDEDEREQGDDRRWLHTPEENEKLSKLRGFKLKSPDSHGMEHDHYLAYGDHLDESQRKYREAFARHDIEVVLLEMQSAFRKRGMPFDPKSQKVRRVGLKILEGILRALDAMQARQRGDVSVELPMPSQRGPKLSEALEQWKQGGGAYGAKRPNPNTALEAENTVRRFMEWHGDIRLGSITKTHAREFRDAMGRVPKALPEKLSRLPLKELLKRDLSAFTPRSATTVNKLLTILAAIVANAMREGRLDDVSGFTNPFDKDVKLRVDAQQIDEREPFDGADLRAIFGTPVYMVGYRPKGGRGEAAFWFPLIGLFSGMRLAEIAGLRIGDLDHDEATGRWFFSITPESGRRVKSITSIRKVPVHRELERIGLLEYREQLFAKGASLTDPLWPEVSSADTEKPSGPWSKWFGRYLRVTAKVTDGRKVFHSFRHTFKRAARSAGLSEELHDALTGHAGGGGVGRSYGRGYPLKPLVDAMDRIAAPENAGISGLRWGNNKTSSASQS